MLPKRDYIGGSEREVGIKVIDKVPGLKDEILRLSKVYGISPNVFTNASFLNAIFTFGIVSS